MDDKVSAAGANSVESEGLAIRIPVFEDRGIWMVTEIIALA
tara:strand:- start:32 stop:154 length:123 start_codon:yes stop_codon:yes gene_type:complete